MKIADTFQHTLTRVFDYSEYKLYVKARYEEGKTTGEGYFDQYLEYTKLNIARNDRIDKNIEILPELEEILGKLESDIRILAITEGWCGDSPQNLPLFAKMEELSKGKIQLDIILRDENLKVMDEFLTNGGRSIPKVIFMDKISNIILAEWGPRPKPVQEMVKENKESGKKSKEEIAVDIQKWYNKDNMRTIQGEVIGIFRELGV